MTEAQLLSVLAAAALKATAILGVAGLVNSAWRSASASTRHLVWTFGVGCALVLPLVGAAIERLGAPRIDVALWTAPTPAPAAHPVSNAVPASPDQPLAASIVESATTNLPLVTSALPTPSTPAGIASLTESVTADWRRTAFYLWMLGVVVALLPLVAGIVRLSLLSRNARLATGKGWTQLIEQTPAISHLARRVRVVESDAATMPMTWGIFAPTLLVPSGADNWPEWQRRNILLHELAHVERRDCLTQLMAQLACAVYWFNPLAWLAAHRMRVEREFACDDQVISAGSPASEYASNLLDVARSLRAPSYTSQTAIAMARPSQLSGRLLAVLDTTRNRRSVTRRLAAGVAFAAVAVVLPLASITPGTASAAVADAPALGFVSPSEIPEESNAPQPAAANIVSKLALPSLVALATSTPPIPLASVGTQDPVCWAETSGSKESGSTNISINDDDAQGRRPTWTVRFTRDNCSLELRAEGKFTLRPDLPDVESLDRDAWLRVEERVGRTTRRMDIRRADNGAIEHSYYVNGDRVAYNDDARAWLASTLLGVERRTAFAAATRVPQIYRSGGLRAVLAEIALMPSAYAKSRYYGALLDTGIALDANTLNGVVRQVSVDLASSDYYMSEVLGKFASQSSANESTWRAFAEAAGRMKSDYYKSQTLKKVLSKGRLSNETVGILLRSASAMESDYYLSELLKSVAAKYAMNAQTSQYYVDALRKIESDYYRVELISAMNKDGEWDARTSTFVLASLGDVKSDYYKSEALRGLLRANHVDDWPRFFDAVGTIGSDYYRKEALIAVMQQEPLSRQMVSGVLAAAAKMSSDSELAEVLTSVARQFKIDDSLRPAFEKAVDAIDSDYYRGAALTALRRSMAR